MTTKSKEDAVRNAAADLKSAIDDAVAAGLRVSWPHRAADLGNIGISETGRVKVATEVLVDPKTAQTVSPAAAQKAANAAQSAAEKAIVKAEAGSRK